MTRESRPVFLNVDLQCSCDVALHTSHSVDYFLFYMTVEVLSLYCETVVDNPGGHQASGPWRHYNQ